LKGKKKKKKKKKKIKKKKGADGNTALKFVPEGGGIE